jgi:hypothetical protein
MKHLGHLREANQIQSVQVQENQREQIGPFAIVSFTHHCKHNALYRSSAKRCRSDSSKSPALPSPACCEEPLPLLERDSITGTGPCGDTGQDGPCALRREIAGERRSLLGRDGDRVRVSNCFCSTAALNARRRQPPLLQLLEMVRVCQAGQDRTSESFLFLNPVSAIESCARMAPPLGGTGTTIWSKTRSALLEDKQVLRAVLFQFDEQTILCSPLVSDITPPQNPRTPSLSAIIGVVKCCAVTLLAGWKNRLFTLASAVIFRFQFI